MYGYARYVAYKTDSEYTNGYPFMIWEGQLNGGPD